MEIHPETPPEGRARGDLGRNPRMAQATTVLQQMAAEEGLDGFQTPALIANSRLALEAAEYVKVAAGADSIAFANFHSAVFRTYFVDGENIGDAAVLRRLVEAAGVDATGLETAWERGRYAPILAETLAEARDYGINGTPSFIAGRYLVVGAQPVAVLEELLQVAASEEATGESDSAADPPPDR